jgi:hypothetical protein
MGKNKRTSIDWQSLRALANADLASQGEVGERFRVAVGRLLCVRPAGVHPDDKSHTADGAGGTNK